MLKEYDLLIIGGGPGGYVAAIRGAQLGFKVAVVEENKLGGVCLHKGCIPTKSFIKSAQVYSLAKQLNKYGVKAGDPTYDFNIIKERTSKVINTLYGGVKSLLSSHKVDVFNCRASLMGASIFSPIPGSVAIPNEEGESDILVSKNIIIATGSSVNTLPGLTIDKEYVITSDEALTLPKVPKSLIIVGGGVIGVEWASLLNSLGCEVTILEYDNNIVPFEDIEVSKELSKQLTKKGVKIITGANVLPETLVKENNKVSIKATINNKEETFSAAKILVAVGRKPNTQGIGLENTKITLDKRGFIEVDSNFRTKEKHIFAIGDVTGFMQLAHVASAAGIYVVELLKGLNPQKINKNNMPKCIYSTPEVGSIGLTEAQATKEGFSVKVSKFPFMANSKALIEEETEGFVKVVVDSKTNDLLGIHIIGCKATELISVGSLAKFLDASGLELGKAVYPHPSISEIISEGALGIYGSAIHKH